MVTSAAPSVSSTTAMATTTMAPPATGASTTTITTSTTTTLPDEVTIVEVTVREGRAVSSDRVDVPLGNRVVMRFDSDARLLVHVHGFDEEFPVEPGVLAVYEFTADIAGIFEVEDHVTHRLLIELQVSP